MDCFGVGNPRRGFPGAKRNTKAKCEMRKAKGERRKAKWEYEGRLNLAALPMEAHAAGKDVCPTFAPKRAIHS